MASGDWGLVLSGGGGKGAYQVGAWRALCELGLDSQLSGISGVSVGAINAVLMACTNQIRAEIIWKAIDPLQFLDIDLSTIQDGIFSREGLTSLIQSNLDLIKVSNSELPIFVNTSQDEGGGHYVARYYQLNGMAPSRIMQILLASSALPVAYPSVVIDEQHHLDGGLTNNVPVKPLYDMGLRKFLVIDVSAESQLIPQLYPEAEIVHVRPSRDIGRLLDGTLDFSGQGAAYRIELGYRDMLRTWNAYQAGELNHPDFAKVAAIDAATDHQQIRVDLMQKKYSDTVNARMEKWDEMIKKLGIDPNA